MSNVIESNWNKEHNKFKFRLINKARVSVDYYYEGKKINKPEKIEVKWHYLGLNLEKYEEINVNDIGKIGFYEVMPIYVPKNIIMEISYD